MSLTYNLLQQSYGFMLPFEADFDLSTARGWMRGNWQKSFLYSAIYVCLIATGRHYMKSKPRFDLRMPLAAWNVTLAVFSILGALRVYPEFFFALTEHGFRYSICDVSFSAGISGFWTWLFTLSKVLELGDTVFVVLRKQELIFLHWYHHVTVLIYTWFAYAEQTSAGRWFMVMNYTVHAFMYSYYALRTFGFRLPRFIPMAITLLQLSQMIVGSAIGVHSYFIKQAGQDCAQSFESIKLSLLMYLSYFLLFAHFFYHAYFHDKAKFRRRRKSSTKVPEAKENGHANHVIKRSRLDAAAGI